MRRFALRGGLCRRGPVRATGQGLSERRLSVGACADSCPASGSPDGEPDETTSSTVLRSHAGGDDQRPPQPPDRVANATS